MKLSQIIRDIMIPNYWRYEYYEGDVNAFTTQTAAPGSTVVSYNLTLTETSHVKVYFGGYCYWNENDWASLRTNIYRDTTQIAAGQGACHYNSGDFIVGMSTCQVVDLDVPPGVYEYKGTIYKRWAAFGSNVYLNYWDFMVDVCRA